MFPGNTGNPATMNRYKEYCNVVACSILISFYNLFSPAIKIYSINNYCCF